MSSTPDHPAFVTTASRALVNCEQQTSSLTFAGKRLAVKDVFDIAGMPTGAGNPDWQSSHPVPADTHASVKTLIGLGAEFVGKTLTDELAYSLNGQNIHYPPLLNPVTPNRLVGGSSSGSAAAVAANLADIGLGTDTGGSIRVPASYNGLFGLRPTHDAIPCDNMLRLAPSFDTVGWLTSDIATLENVAHALLGAQTPLAHAFGNADEQLRCVLVTNLIDNVEHADQIYDWLSCLGGVATTNTVLDIEALATSETFRVLQGIEIWQEHGEWISQNTPTFANDIQKRVDWCRQLTNTQQQLAVRQQRLIQTQVSSVLDEQSVMIIPTTPGRSPLLDMPENALATYREDLMALTAIAGLTGRPQIHLPLFTIEGAPCGVSLIGHKHADLALISAAKKLLQKTNLNPLVSNK